jgi:hypothetical protein
MKACGMVSAGTSKGSAFQCVKAFSHVSDIFFTLEKKMATACVLDLTEILI